ncbi:glycerophosphodiester phosphodiesterase [Hymenobacter sp. NBH84]|uniref:glycerophosphodiester phosphodiesterase family protein n=1 Tax=Hymenobacter sp. NBH84 TaxID=2596915 RepID=UPI00162AB098|nr:glycerophosphodiester phosphodiesterase family protein [Hymenobacter sp. NBH84]QNE41076.1 glycerophosphodiester phosphodiesterase [Hymenobacter sp. NBH84]
MKILLLLPLLAMLTPAPTPPPPLDTQGHRGCRGLLPENTVPAMLKALDLGVTTLEMDAAISQDKQVLLSHDPYMNADFVHTPDGQPLTAAAGKALRLYGLPYAEIRRYDVGSHGNPKFPRQEKLKTYKPLLAEVIDSAEAHARRQGRPLPYYNIETKTTPAGDNTLHPEPEEFVRLLLAVITEKGVQDRVIIQSFDPRTLEVVHRTHPTLRTALLVENVYGLTANLKRLSFRPTIYSPYYKLVTANLVQNCHQQGMQIIPWTINSVPTIKELVAQKVDGIITDYPDLFSEK